MVIIDEIAGSTDYQNSVAIAYGIIKYLHNFNNVFSIISTHHQKLCYLAQNLNSLANHRMKIKMKNNFIEFSHQIEGGINGDIAAIEVARIADMPEEVIMEFNKIISHF